MKYCIALLALLCTLPTKAQPKATEVFLFDLSTKKDKLILSHGENISRHKGYDNQPSFHPAATVLYYSSANDDGRTEIRSYDYKSKSTVTLTQTLEREYSPLVTPDRQYFSCIIQRDNEAQDLGKYPLEGGEATIIVDNLKIGYHVWTDNSHLGLYVLGTPNTLHYLLLPMKRDTIIASNIARSLQRVPGETAFSFIQKNEGLDWTIMKFNNRTRKVSVVGPAISGKEDLCWTPDGKIIMSDGRKIFYYVPGQAGWNEVMMTGENPLLSDITRLAISADGKKLAVIAAE